MHVCTYDNPATMRREVWQDGKEICSYDDHFIDLVHEGKVPSNVLQKVYHMGANIGPWKTGQMVGDAEAITGAIQNS